MHSDKHIYLLLRADPEMLDYAVDRILVFSRR